MGVVHNGKVLGSVDRLTFHVCISLDGAAKKIGTHTKELRGYGTEEQVDVGERLTDGGVGALDGELGN